MKRILVPTDFSTASDRALEQASELARALKAEVHLLHKVVYPPPHPPTELLDRLDDAARFDWVLKDVIERPEREAREALEAQGLASGLAEPRTSREAETFTSASSKRSKRSRPTSS
jgi:nucleotide-binding universal stress UspA family protein